MTGATTRRTFLNLDPTGWPGTIAVASVLAFVVFGTQLADAALPEYSGSRTAGAVQASDDVTVHILDGWTVSGPFDNGIRVERGSVLVDIREFPFDGSSQDFYATYQRDVLEPDATQLTMTAGQEVEVGNRYVGVQGSYVGLFPGISSTVEGRVTAMAFPRGFGVVVDAWAPEGMLAAGLSDVQIMLDTIEIAA